MDPQYIVALKMAGEEFAVKYYHDWYHDSASLKDFYGADSTYKHGPRTVRGVDAIAKEIEKENYRNVQGNIVNVSVRATSSGHITVKVDGEMSNDNGPMRKFTQFFIINPDPTTGECYAFKDEFRFVEEEAHEIFVGRIGSTVKKGQLREHFGRYGEVRHVKLVRGYNRPSHGYVGFTDAESVKRVLENLSEAQKIGDVVIKIEAKKQRDPKDQSPKIKNRRRVARENVSAPAQAPAAQQDEAPIEAQPAKMSYASAVKKETPLEEAVVKPRSDPKPSKPAETKSPADNKSEGSRKKDDRNEKVEYPVEQQLFVGNLKDFVTEAELKNHFGHYGAVARVNIVVARPDSHKPNYGFVVYEDAESVDRVFNNLSEARQMEGCRVNIMEKRQESRQPTRMNQKKDHVRNPDRFKK